MSDRIICQYCQRQLKTAKESSLRLHYNHCKKIPKDVHERIKADTIRRAHRTGKRRNAVPAPARDSKLMKEFKSRIESDPVPAQILAGLKEWQKKFITQYWAIPHITMALRGSGASYKLMWEARRKDQRFMVAWEACQANHVNHLELFAYDRAMGRTAGGSEKLLLALLQAYHPAFKKVNVEETATTEYQPARIDIKVVEGRVMPGEAANNIVKMA